MDPIAHHACAEWSVAVRCAPAKACLTWTVRDQETPSRQAENLSYDRPPLAEAQ